MTSPAFVVLTDFFADEHALAYAAHLAARAGARLVLLHVYQDALLLPEGHPHHRQASEQRTRHALQQLAEAQSVATEVALADDFLPEELAEVVRQYEPLLLVLGRPSPEAVPPEIITSAALDLLRYAACPLLLVPAGSAAPGPPGCLALAADGEVFSLLQAPQVAQLLEGLRAPLVAVHVTSRKDPGAAAGHRVLHALQRGGLTTGLRAGWPHVVYHLQAVPGILQGAAEVQADLLVVVVRQHGLLASLFHRSVAAQLIGQSPLPLLLLPARA